MSQECKHEKTRCVGQNTSADRPPNVFVCDSCGEVFDRDPNNPTGVRYLKEPNPRFTKDFTGGAQTPKSKMND